MSECKHKWKTIKTLAFIVGGWGVQCEKCYYVMTAGLPKWYAEEITEDFNGKGDTR